METSEILKKVRKIEIKTKGLSQNIFAGQYHSAFKGRGMAFAEVREYQFGDDVRDIDWNVTARFRKPYVKVFEEERELTVMLLIDVSGSLDFGTRKCMKSVMATEIAATIAFSAMQNNDKIGVVFFSDRIEKYIPPKKGRKHILYIIREMLDFHPQSTKTNIGEAVAYFTRMMKRRTTAFVISDFYDNKDFLKQFQIANSKHDLMAAQVFENLRRGHLHSVETETLAYILAQGICKLRIVSLLVIIGCMRLALQAVHLVQCLLVWRHFLHDTYAGNNRFVLLKTHYNP